MTPSLDGVALPGPASLIIPNAVIAAAPEFIDAGMDTSVTILVSQDQVQDLVQAMRDGVIDLVAIPVSGHEL
jgi:DNA-binding NtrC family response regulator